MALINFYFSYSISLFLIIHCPFFIYFIILFDNLEMALILIFFFISFFLIIFFIIYFFLSLFYFHYFSLNVVKLKYFLDIELYFLSFELKNQQY